MGENDKTQRNNKQRSTRFVYTETPPQMNVGEAESAEVKRRLWPQPGKLRMSQTRTGANDKCHD